MMMMMMNDLNKINIKTMELKVFMPPTSIYPFTFLQASLCNIAVLLTSEITNYMSTLQIKGPDNFHV
jgi:hypothetical protein